MTQIAFQGEVQLLRWSKTSNAGATVTFQLADAVDLERFETMTLAKKGMVGQRLAVVMVEIGDDELPAVGAKAKPTPDMTLQGISASEQPTPEPAQKPGMLCILACTFCKDPEFHRWLKVENEATAKACILQICHCTSRKDLDADNYFSDRFHKYIRLPFMAWKSEQ